MLQITVLVLVRLRVDLFFVLSQTVQEFSTSFYLSLLSEHRYSFTVILSAWKPSRQHDQSTQDDTLVAHSCHLLLGSFSLSYLSHGRWIFLLFERLYFVLFSLNPQ